MSRPKRQRKISGNPKVLFYKPSGICISELEHVHLSLDEWEALRVFYTEELDQTAGAEKMGISQSTFQRILCSARKKLAIAVLEGKAINIHHFS